MFKQLSKFLFLGDHKNARPDSSDEAALAKKQGDNALANKKLEDAEKFYRQALTLRADFPEAHNNLGLVLEKQERFGEAVECYLNALSIDPGHAPACLNLGNWHKSHGNLDEQLHYYQKAISLKADYHEAHNALGAFYQTHGKIDEAIACFEKALSIKPDFAWAMLNMSLCWRARKQPVEEAAWLKKAMEADPNCPLTRNQLGFVCYEKAELELAEQHYRAALKIDPDLYSAQFNLGTLLLMLGNYDDGFALYESRFKLYLKQILGYDADYFPVLCRAPHWDGGDLNGKTMLLWLEQGLGDNLMMIRYLPELVALGCGKLVVTSRPPLTRIFRHLPYPVEVAETEDELRNGTFDYHCPMTSLPALLKTRPETIPSTFPYIFVPEDMKRKWADRLASIAGPKVGLVWAGNKDLQRDELRSVSLSVYEPFRKVPGITFISLQKGESAEQARGADWVIRDCIDDCEDFLDTAALVENLDLVISVDTSTAHLSGALGKPVWLLNRFESEWRWMIDREYSPWYPTTRIFRQPALHDWTSVITRITEELEVWAANRAAAATAEATTT